MKLIRNKGRRSASTTTEATRRYTRTCPSVSNACARQNVHNENRNLKLRLYAIVFVCCVFCGAPCALGVDYYVATTGDDSHPGTEARPWRTVQKAANTMVAGDTVFIRAGTYVERVTPTQSGTDGGYITYQSYPGEEVVIESPNTWSSDYCFHLPDGSDLHHLRFTGLTLRNANFANFYSDADGALPKHHLIVDGLTIEYGGFGVLWHGANTDSEITNCEIHNTSGGILVQNGAFENILIDGNHVSYSVPYPGFPWGNHNIHIQGIGSASTGVTVANNLIHHAERQGISVWYTNHVLIRGNHNHHNGASGVQIESQVGPGYTRQIVVEQNLCEYNGQNFPAETGIWVDDSSDVIVQDNVLRYNEIGLKITGSPRVLVRRNTVYENSAEPSVVSPGIAVRHATDGDATGDDVIIVHNTLYKNGAPDQRSQVLIGLAGYLPEIQRGVFKNNVSSDCSAQYDLWVSGLTHTLDYNTYHNSLRPLAIVWQKGLATWPVYQAVSGQDANSLTDNPMFADAAGGDFALTMGSPCVDRGDFLTTTLGSGQGTIVPVVDARYFSDGMGVVDGDQIQVGTNQIASVLNVNYQTNAITVDRSITWDAGEGVSYPYQGVAVDMGALESEHAIAIPTVSEWGLVVMVMLLLLIAATTILARRRVSVPA